MIAASAAASLAGQRQAQAQENVARNAPDAVAQDLRM